MPPTQEGPNDDGHQRPDQVEDQLLRERKGLNHVARAVPTKVSKSMIPSPLASPLLPGELLDAQPAQTASTRPLVDRGGRERVDAAEPEGSVA
jgi:hypothetical protein